MAVTHMSVSGVGLPMMAYTHSLSVLMGMPNAPLNALVTMHVISLTCPSVGMFITHLYTMRFYGLMAGIVYGGDIQSIGTDH